ncbi:hypothetical protein BST33_11540 [Mycolicibacter minnesotensis]|uniref:DUF7847 domain-containing protein n=1 Tax=Mycolicibacter minnesotensis TaxID=1118379 RepID=A0AA91M5T7_9MYCO|nr:hypothetical protein BST33_11540 [Mycolicibacter minnesotensis]
MIPLRPLSLTDIYSGAIGYIRTNPKTVFVLSLIVVVATQIISWIVEFGLAAGGLLDPSKDFSDQSGGEAAASLISEFIPSIVHVLGSPMLTGLLTAVVGRAVFGSPTSIEEAWALVRDRFASLLGLVALMSLAVLIGSAAMALGPLLMVAYIYGYMMLVFAPTVIVLERQPVVEALRRSFRLVRHSFWRVLGILALAELIAALISFAVMAPFTLMTLATQGTDALFNSTGFSPLAEIGSAIGQLILLPFIAGVSVLLYTDRRIRSEDFDLVLRTGVTGGSYVGESTDTLWLTPPPGY